MVLLDLPRVGTPFPEAVLACSVLRPDGAASPFRTLLPEGAPSLVVFVRQFTCAGCSERAGEVLASEPVLRDAGVTIVLVGCGEVAHAKAFSERLDLEHRSLVLVTDPTLAIHRAAGLVRSLWGTAGPRATWNLLAAMARGHANHWGAGDFSQLGGTFLLDERRVVLAAHAEAHLGATLPLGDVVERALVLFARRGGAFA